MLCGCREVSFYLLFYHSTGYEREMKSLRSKNLPQRVLILNVNFMADPNMMFYYCLG